MKDKIQPGILVYFHINGTVWRAENARLSVVEYATKNKVKPERHVLRVYEEGQDRMILTDRRTLEARFGVEDAIELSDHICERVWKNNPHATVIRMCQTENPSELRALLAGIEPELYLANKYGAISTSQLVTIVEPTNQSGYARVDGYGTRLPIGSY